MSPKTTGQDHALEDDAARLARAWLQDRHSLDPGIVEPVLEVAAYNGDRAFFDSLVAAAKNTKVKRERDWIIGGISSFRDPAIENPRWICSGAAIWTPGN